MINKPKVKRIELMTLWESSPIDQRAKYLNAL